MTNQQGFFLHLIQQLVEGETALMTGGIIANVLITVATVVARTLPIRSQYHHRITVSAGYRSTFKDLITTYPLKTRLGGDRSVESIVHE